MRPPSSAAIAVAAASMVPTLILARSDSEIGAVLAVSVIALALAARTIVRSFTPTIGMSYPFSRLLSPRYIVPALGLPIAAAAAIRIAGPPAIVAIGLIFAAIAHRYRARLERPGALRAALLPALVGGLFVAIERLALSGKEWRLGGRLLHAEESPRQRVVLVERAGAIDLFIDGEIQLRTADERLYHAALIEPVLAAAKIPRTVLVMGGGDGLAARDLLKCERVERIVIVDWDPAVTRLFRDEPVLAALNEGALRDPRVTTLHRDIREVLARPGDPFDIVIGDLTDPDPRALEDGLLLSASFFRAVAARLAQDGLFVTHASSLDGTRVDELIRNALEEAGFETTSYVRAVPCFGSVYYLIGTLRSPAVEFTSHSPGEAFYRSGQRAD